MIKRLLSILLASVLILTTPISALAETPGGGSTIGRYPTPSSTSAGYKADHGTYKDMGFRITITTCDPILEEGIQPLSGAYSKEDIDAKRAEIEDINRQRYWEPGNHGIYFWANMRQDGVKPHLGVTTSEPGNGKSINGQMIEMGDDVPVGQGENKLAYLCWDTPEGWTRASDAPAYNPELYNIIVQGDANYANGGDWLFDIRQKYTVLTGETAADNRARLTRVVARGGKTADNFRNFSWDTAVTDSGGEITAQHQVMWSFTGYLTMLIQFAWLAQDIGDIATYQEFENAIWAWVTSGYDPRSMPILEIEACAELDTTGAPTNANRNIQLQTIPYILNNMYGTHMSALLYSKWPDNCKDNTTEAIRQFAGDKAPVDYWMVSEALGMYFEGGRVVPHHTDRAYCRKLWPTTDSGGQTTYGYMVCYTYFAEIGPVGDPGPNNSSALGSFTWKLTPDGMHDKTSEKEVNEPSIIYDLNISQNGYNSNNYKQWETVVRTDGIDCNKLRIRIYHISENLAEEQPATKYARDAVKQKGADVTTPINKVTVSPSGNITNFPAGTVTKLRNNTWSGNLTDDQFLKIMKEATGLTYS